MTRAEYNGDPCVCVCVRARSGKDKENLMESNGAEVKPRARVVPMPLTNSVARTPRSCEWRLKYVSRYNTVRARARARVDFPW